MVEIFLELLTGVGWGKNEFNFFPHILQQVEMGFVPLKECQEIYAGVPSPPVESHMCAGNATQNTLQG